MDVVRLLDCGALCLAPPIIYYYGTDLSDYEVLASVGYGAFASLISASVKVVVAALISITDVVLLWYALTKFSHRNISNTHKYQAVGTGWAAANALLFQFAPILSGGFTSEFSVTRVLRACQANVFLVHMLSMAAVGVLFWSKRSKPAGVLPVLRVVLFAHAVLPAIVGVLEDLHHISVGQALVLQGVSTAALAAGSYLVWQQCNPKIG
eukprot:gene4718-4966_t